MKRSILDNPEMRDLFAAMANIKSAREAKFFLRDLCTLTELKEMATRWQVAQRVRRGLPYRNIAKQTGASTATVSRVASWLHHGTGGYKLMLSRFGHRLRAIT
jgi:TrpR-related protein YerC/YecD